MKIECIQHLFLECDYVQNLRTTFENFINETWANVIDMKLKEEIIWFGNTIGCNSEEYFYFLLLFTKIVLYVYTGETTFQGILWTILNQV